LPQHSINMGRAATLWQWLVADERDRFCRFGVFALAWPASRGHEVTMEQLRETLKECSLPAALEAMGERWAFLILRAAFNGLHHFEEFQSELGIARNILANRLGRLVEHGILKREAMADVRRKVRYSLTEKGFALMPTMVALRQWGERWETCQPAFPVLVDARDRRPIAPMAVRAHDGRVLGKGEMIWARPEELGK